MRICTEMTVQRKSLVLSIFLHCVIFFIIFVASGITKKTSQPIIIDLTISSTASSGKESPQKYADTAPLRVADRRKAVPEKPRVAARVEPERRQAMAPTQTPALPVESLGPESVPVGRNNGSSVAVKSEVSVSSAGWAPPFQAFRLPRNTGGETVR